MGLLAPCDQRLAEEAAQRIAPVETQVAGTLGEAEEFVRPWGAEPLEVERKLRLVEIFALGRGGEGVGRQRRSGDSGVREPQPVRRAQPAVLAPPHALDRGLAAQRATPAVGNGASAEVHQVDFPGLGFHDVGMSGALQCDIRAMARGQDVGIGMQLVRPHQLARAGEGDGVAPPGASLCRQQIVVSVALVEVRAFGEADGRALEDETRLPRQAALRGGVLLQHDSGKAVIAGAVVPQHVHEVFAPVVVVEEGGIETAAVEVNRIAPLAVDGRAGDEVVVGVAQRGSGEPLSGAPVALDVGVDEVEQASVAGEARRPDAAGIGIAEHVELRGAAQRAREEAPVNQVA